MWKQAKSDACKVISQDALHEIAKGLPWEVKTVLCATLSVPSEREAFGVFAWQRLAHAPGGYLRGLATRAGVYCHRNDSGNPLSHPR